jgi:hypothetical protein
MLSETLLVTFRHFFHPYHADSPLLVQPVVIQDISDFLSGRGDTRSAFARFDIREPDGSFCRVTSHQFRHWLNYIADKGGLPVDLQTRWLGRENPRDTEAYRHATVDERLALVKEGIRNGQLSGAKADAFFELPHSKRDLFLEAEIQAVHVTAFGFCLHDFAVTPCQYHLNCVRGCPDYLRTKGSSSERDHLVQIQLSRKAHSQARRLEVMWRRHGSIITSRLSLVSGERSPSMRIPRPRTAPWSGRSQRPKAVSDAAIECTGRFAATPP